MAAMKDMVNSLEERLCRIGWTETDSGCWEWNGSRAVKRGGYGQLRFNRKTWKAHRAAYAVWVGELEPGKFICHKCDNPPCMNPNHLYQGTPKSNSSDMWTRGRGVQPRFTSDKAPGTKLTRDDVDEIRDRLQAGQSLTEIGRAFGVTKQCIYNIREKKTWTTEKLIG